MKENDNYSVIFENDGRCTLCNQTRDLELVFRSISQLVNFCNRMGIEVLIEDCITCNFDR